MAAREYQGSGGLRLHLDEPLSPEMAKQVAKGHLVPVVAEADGQVQSPADPLPASGSDVSAGLPAKPTAASKVADWRAYAVHLGMPEEDAKDATKTECQDYVQVVEDADNSEQAEGQE